MQRRNFIRLSLIAASCLVFPLEGLAKHSNTKTLVLVELNGGNDSLNTVVPYKSENYYELRKNIAIKKEDLRLISDELGLNKTLSNIGSLYENKQVAIVNGLGYDKPNLSHFRSIEIVETASKSNEYLTKGWLSSELERFPLNELTPTPAMVIGKRKKGHLFSKEIDVIQLKNIDNFMTKSTLLSKNKIDSNDNAALDFFMKQNISIEKTNKAFNKYTQDITINTKFETTDISNDFKEAVKIIKSPMNIPVIKISHSGYDTHAGQVESHETLLKDLDNAIGSFVKELETENLFDEVLIVTYSEFGRRVKENGSFGTDHGTASSQFVLGGKVKGGLYGKFPDMNMLIKNNLIYTTEYTSLYNTILSSWFEDKNNAYKDSELLAFL